MHTPFLWATRFTSPSASHLPSVAVNALGQVSLAEAQCAPFHPTLPTSARCSFYNFPSFPKSPGAPAAATSGGCLYLPFIPPAVSAEQRALSDRWATSMPKDQEVAQPPYLMPLTLSSEE